MRPAFAALLLCLMALAAQAAPRPNVQVTAKTTGLKEDEAAIVNGFLELIQGIVGANGNMGKMKDVLADIKDRVDKKLKMHGASYLDTLGETLTKVYIAPDDVQAILDSINGMATKDGVKLRSKRSPKPCGKGKKKKKKKKKGCGKK